MIRITVELVPAGFEERSEMISRMIIYNRATSGSSEIGNYAFYVDNKDSEIQFSGMVDGFNRKEETVWDLLKMILNKYR